MEKNPVKRLSLRILLAEDNEINQKVAQALLRSLGYDCDVVNNGLEALDALRRQPYDVVLMDMQMPQMDGLEASRQIRRQWPTEKQPRIVALTANAMAGDRERCLEAGMDSYISKPVKAADLQEALERCVTTGNTEPVTATPSPGTYPIRPSFLDLQQEGEPDIFAELLDFFISDTPAHLENLCAAVQQRDPDKLERAAHSLKGSCACMGIERMAALSAELEKKGREGLLEKAEIILAQLEEEFEQIRRSVITSL